MKKKWVFSLFVTVMITIGNADATTLFTDGFDTSAAPAFSANWGVVDVSGTDGNWLTSTASIHPAGISPHSAPNMAVFNSYTTVAGQTRLYQTSGIDLSSRSNAEVSLWMHHDMGYATNSHTVQVQVSTDAGGTWNNVGAPITRYDGTTQWTQHTINIDAYTGGGMTDVRIGFLGISNYGNDTHIDDIAITTVTYTVTPSKVGNGTISPDTPQNINPGATATFTVTPDTGYTASVGGTCGGTLIDTTYTTNAIVADCSVDATFTINTYTLTVSKTGTGKGTVTSTPTGINCGTDCSEMYDFGTDITLTADPADNSVFIGWSGGDCTGTGVCTVTMDD